jgi:CRISPR-associated exonuclease Cas4
MTDLDDDYLPVSALQHLAFCPRQCALIHIECQWQENVLTARGRLEHERVDDGYKEFRRGKCQISALAIRSETLRLQGQLDVLELELIDAAGSNNLSALGVKGTWRAFPVEFKHGEPKENDCDRIQLCAQAICLEEMLNIRIETASLFYQRIRRREDVLLDEPLRVKTAQAAQTLHELFLLGKTPPPVYSKRCKSCSMLEICLPQKMAVGAGRYRRTLFTPQEPLP